MQGLEQVGVEEEAAPEFLTGLDAVGEPELSVRQAHQLGVSLEALDQALPHPAGLSAVELQGVDVAGRPSGCSDGVLEVLGHVLHEVPFGLMIQATVSLSQRSHERRINRRPAGRCRVDPRGS